MVGVLLMLFLLGLRPTGDRLVEVSGSSIAQNLANTWSRTRVRLVPVSDPSRSSSGGRQQTVLRGKLSTSMESSLLETMQCQES